MHEEPLLRTTCVDTGIPFLFLDNDYEWTGVEQMKTGVEAFMAMAGGRRLS
jgi:benzoyl-CoA reductase/2-hydroxyglutaryl-CoA dehydratase subunit BcrC/BadD/HgdB